MTVGLAFNKSETIRIYGGERGPGFEVTISVWDNRL